MWNTWNPFCHDANMCECEDPFKPAEKFVTEILGKNSARAYVVIYTDEWEEYEVLKNLNRIPEVKAAYVSHSGFMIFYVIWKVSWHSILEKAIINTIRSLHHIQTSIALNVITEKEWIILKSMISQEFFKVVFQ